MNKNDILIDSQLALKLTIQPNYRFFGACKLAIGIL